MFVITKEFGFEMAHILDGHKGLCLNLHGHSYKMLVSVAANECNDGMVMDFADLKSAVVNNVINKVDHAFCFNTTTNDVAEKEIFQVLKAHKRKVFELDKRATAENLSKHFFDVLEPILSGLNYKLNKVALFETPTSFCEYSL